MQFLRALFWLVLGIALAVFTVGNWRDVTLDIWGGLQADVKIPVLVIGAFLAGLLPMWIAARVRGFGRSRAPTPEPSYAPPHSYAVPTPVAPVLNDRTELTPDGVLHSHAGFGSAVPGSQERPPIAGGA